VRVQPTVQDSWRPRRHALAKAGGDRFGDGAHDAAATGRETDRPNEPRSALYVLYYLPAAACELRAACTYSGCRRSTDTISLGPPRARIRNPCARVRDATRTRLGDIKYIKTLRTYTYMHDCNSAHNRKNSCNNIAVAINEGKPLCARRLI
jgi:hypothetical protein